MSSSTPRGDSNLKMAERTQTHRVILFFLLWPLGEGVAGFMVFVKEAFNCRSWGWGRYTLI